MVMLIAMLFAWIIALPPSLVGGASAALALWRWPGNLPRRALWWGGAVGWVAALWAVWAAAASEYQGPLRMAPGPIRDFDAITGLLMLAVGLLGIPAGVWCGWQMARWLQRHGACGGNPD